MNSLRFFARRCLALSPAGKSQAARVAKWVAQASRLFGSASRRVAHVAGRNHRTASTRAAWDRRAGRPPEQAGRPCYPGRFQRRLVRSCAAVIAALTVGPPSHGQVEERPAVVIAVDGLLGATSAGGPAREKSKLPPELEKQVQSWLGDVKEVKRTAWAAKMAREIEDVAVSAGLLAEEKKLLETAAREAVAQCLPSWLEKVDEMYRGQLLVQPQMMDALREQTLVFANEGIVAGEPDPMKHEVWAKGWKAALQPPQVEKWEKVLAARAAKVEEEIKETLKAMADGARENCRAAIARQIEEIQEALALPADRVALLDALGLEAIEKSIAAWTPRAQREAKELVSQVPNQIPGLVDISIDLQPAEYPEVQPVWTAGLAKLLTAAELKRLEDRRTERQARRVRFVSQLLLLFLDEKVALTARQRERLLPLAHKLVLEQYASFLPEDPRQDNYLSPSSFLQVFGTAPEKEVRETMGDAQWARLKKETPQTPGQIPGLSQVPEQEPPGADESIEQTISDFMEAQAARRRARVTEPLLLEVEDAARVAGLSPSTCARLRTAAYGAAERSMKVWIEGFEQAVRGNLSEVTPEDLPQQLGMLQSFESAEGMSTPPAVQPLWKKCVAAELTTAQRAAWQAELDARQLYRNQTIIGTVMTELDRRIPLSGEQWQKLEVMLTGLFKTRR